MKLKVIKSLHDESKQAWVWIPNDLPKIERNQRLIRVTNLTNRESITVSKRLIDADYLKNRQSSNATMTDCIVINQHYRNILNVNSDETIDFEITPLYEFDFFSYYQFYNQHPDDTARLAFWIAFVSLLVGLLSIFLTVYPWLSKGCL